MSKDSPSIVVASSSLNRFIEKSRKGGRREKTTEPRKRERRGEGGRGGERSGEWDEGEMRETG